MTDAISVLPGAADGKREAKTTSYFILGIKVEDKRCFPLAKEAEGKEGQCQMLCYSRKQDLTNSMFFSTYIQRMII